MLKYFNIGLIGSYGRPGSVANTLRTRTGGRAKPLATVEQAFFAEALGYASNISQREDRQVKVAEIIPDDLKDLLDKKIDFQ